MKTKKRLATTALSLAAITVLAFGLGEWAPGDPALLRAGPIQERAGSTDFERRYLRARREMELDLPTFYFSVMPLSYPDTFHRVAFDRPVLRAWLWQFGDWDGVWTYYAAVKNVPMTDDSARYAQKMLLSEKPDFAPARERCEFSSAIVAWERLRKNPRRWRNFVPVFRFHGKDCRYHRWLTTGGVSYRDFRPVGEKVREALWRTLGLNATALTLGVGLALATAVGTFGRPRWERWVKNLCLGMYSVPTFWAATMLITVFAGGVWSIFPTQGWSPAWEDGAGNAVADKLWRLTLPLICLMYPLWAFWTLQFRQSLHAESLKPYVTAARAWGTSEKRILFPMMMKNAAGPSLALLAGSLPGVLAGSFVVETLFSLPGMGLLAYDAVVFRDYPVLTAVFVLSAAVTLVANFLADIVVAKLNPTIQQT